MQQCVYLLHQLVFASVSGDSAGGDDINIDLRQKLYHAPPQMFNGLAHMFIVMISRLSYADPPEWLSAELQTQVLKLTGWYHCRPFLVTVLTYDSQNLPEILWIS